MGPELVLVDGFLRIGGELAVPAFELLPPTLACADGFDNEVVVGVSLLCLLAVGVVSRDFEHFWE